MRTSILQLVAVLSVVIGSLAISGPALASDDSALGKEAPEFKLTDTEGKEHALSDYTGQIVVLLWITRECPYSERILDKKLVQKAIRESRKQDKKVVWLLINSTAGVTAKENKTLKQDYKLNEPILIDTDGKIAKKYGARSTTQTFVIDASGKLMYSGAFDNDPNGSKGEDGKKKVTNHAVEMVKKLASGEEVKPKSNRPYGCRIKFSK